MSAAETIHIALTKHLRGAPSPCTAADNLLAQYNTARRTEAFNEAIAALQAMHDLAPNGPRAAQLAFSVGVLMGTRDFPSDVPSADGGIAVNAFTDRVYRDAYATGRAHAGVAGWRLAEFFPAFNTSDGTDCPVSEQRHRPCGELIQSVGPQSLIDLMAMAAQHKCEYSTEGGAVDA